MERDFKHMMQHSGIERFMKKNTFLYLSSSIYNIL